MFEVIRRFVGNRYTFKGQVCRCVAETDSGNVQVIYKGKPVWTTFNNLQPKDGQTKGFHVLAIAA